MEKEKVSPGISLAMRGNSLMKRFRNFDDEIITKLYIFNLKIKRREDHHPNRRILLVDKVATLTGVYQEKQRAV